MNSGLFKKDSLITPSPKRGDSGLGGRKSKKLYIKYSPHILYVIGVVRITNYGLAISIVAVILQIILIKNYKHQNSAKANASFKAGIILFIISLVIFGFGLLQLSQYFGGLKVLVWIAAGLVPFIISSILLFKQKISDEKGLVLKKRWANIFIILVYVTVIGYVFLFLYNDNNGLSIDLAVSTELLAGEQNDMPSLSQNQMIAIIVTNLQSTYLKNGTYPVSDEYNDGHSFVRDWAIKYGYGINYGSTTIDCYDSLSDEINFGYDTPRNNLDPTKKVKSFTLTYCATDKVTTITERDANAWLASH
jgi:hypothetical protein